MNALYLSKQFYQYLAMALVLSILSACSTQLTQKDEAPELFSKLSNNSTYYLQKADQVSNIESFPWQLVALQSLITENKPLIANSIIEYLQSQTLTPVQENALKVLVANNHYQQQQAKEALALLNQVDDKLLSEPGIIYFLELKIRLQVDQQAHLEASDDILVLMPLLKSAPEMQYYSDLLFSQLILLPPEILAPATEQMSVTDTQQTAPVFDVDSILDPLAEGSEVFQDESLLHTDPAHIKQGWYDLASLYQRYQLRPNQLVRSLDDWKKNNPMHPAIEFMPSQLTSLPELSPYQPRNIAVLIPLSGRYKPQGEAIQYGLLHAYYGQQDGMFSNSSPVTLHFFDTQLLEINEIVAQLQVKEIDFVIGPLLKNKVEEFLPLVDKLPVLALNSFPKSSNGLLPTNQATMQTQEEGSLLLTRNSKTPWHYAFPLSPEEEAKQAAQFIYAQGHKKPLLIAAESTFGQRIATVFELEWERLNRGDLSKVETYYFNKNAQLAPFIERALQTDKSKRRIEQMKMITGLPLEASLRSRSDIDAIYIVSKRNELLLLKAFIDVSISPFASEIPLYASSRSHSEDSHNIDLAKLTFSDSPFLLDTNKKIFQKVQRIWGKHSLTKFRLFALGFDSYQLIEQLVNLQSTDNYTYKGLVGQLTLNSANTIEAQLNWATYLKGKVVEITAPVSAE